MSLHPHSEADIIAIASDEIIQKNFGVTQQYLDVHEIEFENGVPRILCIDYEQFPDNAVVYFQVKDYSFYFAVRVNIKIEPKVTFTWNEPRHKIRFIASSNQLSADELQAIISLSGNETITINTHAQTEESTKLVIESTPWPGNFKQQLKRFLDYLLGDASGINRLVGRANGCLEVESDFYIGNGHLGGYLLDNETIAKLTELNVSISFIEKNSGIPIKLFD